LRVKFSLSLLIGGAIVAATGAAATDGRPPATVCGHAMLETGLVASVLDGRTLTLVDGREIRLAGIEIPLGEAGLAAMDALRGLVADLAVALKGPSSTDRYGRLVVYPFVLREGSEQGVVPALLAGGYGLVRPSPETACTAENFVAERAARRDKLGLWADPYYDIIKADSPTAIAERRGTFSLVEGKVVSVRESGNTIYVNFGRRWSEDFAVTMQKRNERAFVDGGIEPKKLEGRRVRVRGWIEERGGPRIEALHPAQLEIVDGI
jgi:endonuclease YncB( thermonuclease family)